MERKYLQNVRESVNYSEVAQERDCWRTFINSVLYLSQKMGNIRWTTVSFSRRTLLQEDSHCSLKTLVGEAHVRLAAHLLHIQTYWKSYDYLNFLGKKMCVVMIICTTRHNKWLTAWRNIRFSMTSTTFVPDSCLKSTTIYSRDVWTMDCTPLFLTVRVGQLYSRSRWPHGLRRGCAATPLLGLSIWIAPGTWICVYCECRVLCCQVEVSATGRSLAQRNPADCMCVRARARARVCVSVCVTGWDRMQQ
jgi:hypothetical protein